MSGTKIDWSAKDTDEARERERDLPTIRSLIHPHHVSHDGGRGDGRVCECVCECVYKCVQLLVIEQLGPSCKECGITRIGQFVCVCVCMCV